MCGTDGPRAIISISAEIHETLWPPLPRRRPPISPPCGIINAYSRPRQNSPITRGSNQWPLSFPWSRGIQNGAQRRPWRNGINRFDKMQLNLYLYNMVKTLISSKGQTTIPSHFRKRWKSSKILWQSNPDGSAVVRPVPTVASLFGIASSKKGSDPREMERGRKAMAADAAQEGPSR